MGGLFGTGKARTSSGSSSGTGGVAPSLPTVSAPAYGLSTEFKSDNVTRMPTPDSFLAAAAALRRQLLASSGRESTRLVGTNVYHNTFFGDTG